MSTSLERRLIERETLLRLGSAAGRAEVGSLRVAVTVVLFGDLCLHLWPGMPRRTDVEQLLARADLLLKRCILILGGARVHSLYPDGWFCGALDVELDSFDLLEFGAQIDRPAHTIGLERVLALDVVL